MTHTTYHGAEITLGKVYRGYTFPLGKGRAFVITERALDGSLLGDILDGIGYPRTPENRRELDYIIAYGEFTATSSYREGVYYYIWSRPENYASFESDDIDTIIAL